MFDFSLLDSSILLDVDSYKFSHYKMMERNVAILYSYIESRGGVGDATVFVGPQMYVKRYLLSPITHNNIDHTKEIITAHGLPFNEGDWRYIVDHHRGFLPLRIKAVREGTVVPKHNVLTTVENTDYRLAWLTSFIETSYLRACWYPTNVATVSYEAKRILAQALKKSSDLTDANFDQKLSFMLHDFGARSAASKEAAAIGGLGHLTSFMGTDTVGALLAARVFYGEPMAGFSISASEHSTVTSWGREHEVDFYRNQLHEFGKPGALFASVIDSYDADAAIRDLWGGVLKDELIKSGAKVVLRPDSGVPEVVVPRLLDIAGCVFHYTRNSKGYKVLPPYVGMIQGDGITLQSLPIICEAILAAGWSLENMAFGMGSGLLNGHNRDTHKFAMKGSAVFRCGGTWSDHMPISGVWEGIRKHPKDDPFKASKQGLLGLYRTELGYETAKEGGANDLLEVIYENGQLVRDQTLKEVRQLAAS